MQNDDDLRDRFRALAAEESSGAPAFSPAAIKSGHSAPDSRDDRSQSRWTRRVALGGAAAAGAVIALTIGLVWGTNTGYASARVEGQRQRDEMAAATTEVQSRLAALRVDLARVRSDLARRARTGDDGAKASLILAESELRSMEASAERIELDLAGRRAGVPSLPPIQMIGFPMKRALAITCNALSAPAAPAAPLQQGIPIVDLPPASVKTNETFGGILGIRQSSDGNVLVNDAARRQMKLLDSTLSTSTVVIDSTPGTSASYGPFAVPLIPYLGDSSLFGDRNTRTMLVLDGRGHVARALALPKPSDFLSINSGPSSVDAEGRLIYRAYRAFGPRFPQQGRGGGSDSVAVLRADLDFRRIDTIGRVSRPVMKVTTEPTSDGRTAYVFAPDPLQPVDEWAVLSSGAVAFLRGHDYHVDWLQSSGELTATPKLQFDWKRLTEEDKQRLADSVRAGQNALLANGYSQAEYAIRIPCEPGPPAAGAVGRSGGSGGGSDNPPGGEPRDRNCTQIIQTSGIPSVGGVPARQMQSLPPLADLARGGPIQDYMAPFARSSTMADRDGNLWILPRMSTLSKHGELVYDVVNSEGKLFQRVRLPEGRAIAGFGKGGVVYLQSGDRTNGFRLERTRLAPPTNTAPK